MHGWEGWFVLLLALGDVCGSVWAVLALLSHLGSVPADSWRVKGFKQGEGNHLWFWPEKQGQGKATSHNAGVTAGDCRSDLAGFWLLVELTGRTALPQLVPYIF